MHVLSGSTAEPDLRILLVVGAKQPKSMQLPVQLKLIKDASPLPGIMTHPKFIRLGLCMRGCLELKTQ